MTAWICSREAIGARFPDDFMFQLSENEKQEVVANCDHLNNLKFSPVLPYAFTEQAVVLSLLGFC
ncbi:ORF6N domain-containing protein [Planctomycetota bacterium]